MGFELPKLPGDQNNQEQIPGSETETKSTNSELQSLQQTAASKLREQNLRILEMDDIIEEQNEMIEDLQKEVEELKEENQNVIELSRQVGGDLTRIEGAKYDAEERARSAESRLREATEQMSAAKQRLKEAERKLHEIEGKISISLLAALGYGIMMAMLAGVRTAEFQLAWDQFWQMVADTGPSWITVLGFPARFAHLADGIEDTIKASIMYWIVLLGTCGALIWGVRWCIGRVREVWTDHRSVLAGWGNVATALVSVAAGIFFARPMQETGVNAIVLILLINIGYSVVRGIVVSRDT